MAGAEDGSLVPMGTNLNVPGPETSGAVGRPLPRRHSELTLARAMRIIRRLRGAWRSLVAHLLWEQGVGGSNPSAPTTVWPGRSFASEVRP